MPWLCPLTKYILLIQIVEIHVTRRVPDGHSIFHWASAPGLNPHLGHNYSSKNNSEQHQEEPKLLQSSSPPFKALKRSDPNYHSLPSASTGNKTYSPPSCQDSQQHHWCMCCWLPLGHAKQHPNYWKKLLPLPYVSR